MLIGLGASAMELIYCSIAFTGFSSFFDHRIVKASMEVFSFVFLLFLGMKFLSAKTVERCPRNSAPPPEESRRASTKNCIRTRRS